MSVGDAEPICAWSMDGCDDVGVMTRTFSGKSFVSTATTIDGHSPSSGADRWTKQVAGGSAPTSLIVDPITITPKAIQWIDIIVIVLGAGASVGDVAMELTFGAGSPGAGQSPVVELFHKSSVNSVAWRLGSGNEGSTLYTVTASSSEIAKCRLRLDGTRVQLFTPDGGETPEIDIADTSRLTESRVFLRFGLLDTSQVLGIDAILGLQSDSGDDRPGYAVDCESSTPNDNWATENDWGDDGDCTGTDGVYQDVQLDGSLQADDTTYWCEEQQSPTEQMNELTTPTALVGTHVATIVMSRHRVNAGSKIVTLTQRFHDGTNSSVVSTSVGATSFSGRVFLHQTGPNGAQWNTVTLSSLKGGCGRPVDGDVANLETSGWHTVFFAVDGSAEPASAQETPPQIGMF